MSEYIEPQRKLSHLRSLQMKVKELTFMIEDLKKGLEEDYKNKKISSKFSFAGINATRNRKPEKWQYSTNLLDYEKEVITEISKRKQKEREELIAERLETGTYWRIS